MPDDAKYGDIVPVIQPLMEALRGLADAAEKLAGTTGIALDGSQAMDELGRQGEFVGLGAPDPVHSAHANAGTFRFAATDALRQFAKLFDSQPVPVYSHLAVARAGLEAAALGYWAADRGIGVRTRVQRFQLLRLRNCEEMIRSPMLEYKDRGRVVKAQIRQQCGALGWEVICNEKRIEVAGHSLPGSGALIRSLLSEGSNESGPLQRIGSAAWWFQSGVSHALNYALLESVEPTEVTVSALGSQQAPIFTSSRAVGLQAIILGLGFRSMMQEHRLLFGWSDDTWATAVGAFFIQYGRVIGAEPPP